MTRPRTEASAAKAARARRILTGGDPARAVHLYEELLANHPDQRDLVNNLAVAFLKAGRREDARDLLAPAVRRWPDAAELHLGLGVALRELGELEPAVKSLERGLELEPDSAAAHHQLGLVMLAMGRPREAQRSFRRALELGDGSVALRTNLGAACDALEEFPEALDWFEEAAGRAPDDPSVLVNLGNARLRCHDIEGAETALRRARELAPASAGPALALATCYAQQRYQSPERTRDAIELLEGFLEDHPAGSIEARQRARIHYLLGTLHDDAAGGYAAAIEAYRRGLALDPGSALAHNNLGAILLSQGELDQALEHLLQALALEPESPRAHQNLAKLLFHRLAEDRVREVFRRLAASRDVRTGDCLFHVARWLVVLATHGAHEELFSRTHQVKNILGLTASQARRLRRELLEGRTPDVPRRLESLEGECETAYKILVDLLKFMQPDPLAVAELDVARLGRCVLQRYRRAHAGQIRFRFTAGRALPPVLADPGRIQEALENLLTNAVEAIRADADRHGRGQIGVRISRDRLRQQLVIEVEDDGPGLPLHLTADDLVQAGCTTRDEGSGLGLAICRRILREHGGDLEIADRRPRGARARLRIPLCADPHRGETARWTRPPRTFEPEALLVEEIVRDPRPGG